MYIRVFLQCGISIFTLVVDFNMSSISVRVYYLCSEVRVLAEAVQKAADVRPRQQTLHQPWTGRDLLEQ